MLLHTDVTVATSDNGNNETTVLTTGFIAISFATTATCYCYVIILLLLMLLALLLL